MFAPIRPYGRPYVRLFRFARRLACPISLILLLSLGAGASTSANVVYINKNATGATHDGTTWGTAFLTVQAGIDGASSGDEVWVAKSKQAAPSYVENITLKTGVALYGGFAGTETGRSQRDWKTNATVLNGNGNTEADVVTSAAQGGILDGFVVSNGRYGVSISGGTAGVTNCTINGSGVGVYVSSSATASVTNCAISGNSSGIYLGSGTVSVTNCTVSGNTVQGVFVSTGTATFTNCIVTFNRIGILQWTNSATVTLSCNDVFGNTSDNYRNIPDMTGFNGNLRQDPLFANSTGGDFHLLSSSPCVDAGDDTAVTPNEIDLDGQPRIYGSHVDMGAYEFGPIPYTFQDAAQALRFGAGLTNASPDDITHLNVETGSPQLDLNDAVRIARKASGLDPNP